jgi:hypothetical protein
MKFLLVGNVCFHFQWHAGAMMEQCVNHGALCCQAYAFAHRVPFLGRVNLHLPLECICPLSALSWTSESALCECVQVWEWLASLTPEERGWIYTPKAERAAGLVEGLKAIIADKLAAKAAKARAKAKRQQAQALALQSQSPSPASSGMKALRAGG